MHRLFYASPALRFVEILCLGFAWNSSSMRSVADVNHFVEQFPRLRRLDVTASSEFDWFSFLRSEGALKLPELVAHMIRKPTWNDELPSGPSEFDFLRYSFECSRLDEGVGKFVKLPFEVAASRSFLVTALRLIAKADRTITVQFEMKGEPNLSVHEFSIRQFKHGKTHYKSRNSTISVYQEYMFFTVTNDPSFCPFVIV
ncbi:hypothetical protein AAVH_30601 [Aphelenchoides avenae]|nr:hypothetical protein AAVH_30601 [Aphelenchus avenae]